MSDNQYKNYYTNMDYPDRDAGNRNDTDRDYNAKFYNRAQRHDWDRDSARNVHRGYDQDQARSSRGLINNDYNELPRGGGSGYSGGSPDRDGYNREQDFRSREGGDRGRGMHSWPAEGRGQGFGRNRGNGDDLDSGREWGRANHENTHNRSFSGGAKEYPRYDQGWSDDRNAGYGYGERRDAANNRRNKAYNQWGRRQDHNRREDRPVYDFSFENDKGRYYDQSSFGNSALRNQHNAGAERDRDNSRWESRNNSRRDPDHDRWHPSNDRDRDRY